MIFSTQQRVEEILQTIDRLGIVKIKHLQQIHSLKYRNTCHIISTHLRPYIHENYYQKEKVIYLNKKGRDLIGSEREETKVAQKTIHSLMRNEVYIYFQCPLTWENEKPIESDLKALSSFEISFQIGTLTNKKRIVSDAIFSRNGYQYFIEVDNTQDMATNKKKIESYREIIPNLQGDVPFLYFFTTTENRKKKLKEWLKGMRSEVLTFDEIK